MKEIQQKSLINFYRQYRYKDFYRWRLNAFTKKQYDNGSFSIYLYRNNKRIYKTDMTTYLSLGDRYSYIDINTVFKWHAFHALLDQGIDPNHAPALGEQ